MHCLLQLASVLLICCFHFHCVGDTDPRCSWYSTGTFWRMHGAESAPSVHILGFGVEMSISVLGFGVGIRKRSP